MRGTAIPPVEHPVQNLDAQLPSPAVSPARRVLAMAVCSALPRSMEDHAADDSHEHQPDSAQDEVRGGAKRGQTGSEGLIGRVGQEVKRAVRECFQTERSRFGSRLALSWLCGLCWRPSLLKGRDCAGSAMAASRRSAHLKGLVRIKRRSRESKRDSTVVEDSGGGAEHFCIQTSAAVGRRRRRRLAEHVTWTSRSRVRLNVLSRLSTVSASFLPPRRPRCWRVCPCHVQALLRLDSCRRSDGASRVREVDSAGLRRALVPRRHSLGSHPVSWMQLTPLGRRRLQAASLASYLV